MSRRLSYSRTLIRTTNNPWLTRFAFLTALATLCLLGIGGLVTSHEAGMAVPDWPTTYGYNMFFFPVSRMVGGIFYEHSHRLVASGVGFLTATLAVWIWLKDSRRWMRWLGGLAFFLVALQGLLGGLRVTLYKDEIGIFHGTLAQLFFALVCLIVLFTTQFWQKLGNHFTSAPGLNKLFVGACLLILCQLALGATMRHQHAGLAISDFPLAHGKLWPDTSTEAIARYNQQRTETVFYQPITAPQIVLQMVHRIVAVAILLLVGICAVKATRRLGPSHFLSKFCWIWSGLILLQAILGAATVLTNKSADIATAHVVIGSLNLAMGAQIVVLGRKILVQSRAPGGTREPRELACSGAEPIANA
jgi:cytochrome c oxidase assembly protein subunit 15